MYGARRGPCAYHLPERLRKLQGPSGVRIGRGSGEGRRRGEAASFAAGDAVSVGVRRSAGMRAVVLAYVGALAVLMAVLVAAIAGMGWSEGAGALAAIAGVGVYYFVLWLFRAKIEHTIQFTITKI